MSPAPTLGETLKALQAPLKAKYREHPESAVGTLRAVGRLHPERLTCELDVSRPKIEAGLHPMAGGDGTGACSGEILLEALVACAGVTLTAVAAAMAIPLRGGTVTAEGDLDFRGTLGVSKEVPVGFTAIRLAFDLDADATAEQRATLLKLTERYCVVYQTLAKPPSLSASATPG